MSFGDSNQKLSDVDIVSYGNMTNHIMRTVAVAFARDDMTHVSSRPQYSYSTDNRATTLHSTGTARGADAGTVTFHHMCMNIVPRHSWIPIPTTTITAR